MSSIGSLKFLQAVFRERCEARAYLFAIGEFDLHEAVDVLQADASRTGLVDHIGQDAVQAIMAAAFAPVPDEVVPDPSPTITNDAVGSEIAASTIDAAEYLVRQNDPARLKVWLAKHTRAERLAIKKHFLKRRHA